jgi:hypothetical protein
MLTGNSFVRPETQRESKVGLGSILLSTRLRDNALVVQDLRTNHAACDAVRGQLQRRVRGIESSHKSIHVPKLAERLGPPVAKRVRTLERGDRVLVVLRGDGLAASR